MVIEYTCEFNESTRFKFNHVTKFLSIGNLKILNLNKHLQNQIKCKISRYMAMQNAKMLINILRICPIHVYRLTQCRISVTQFNIKVNNGIKFLSFGKLIDEY